VSRVAVSDAFDIEQDSASGIETDPSDTLRSNSSRAWRNGLSSLGRSSGSVIDRIPSRYHPPSESSQSSGALDAELDDGHGYDRDAANVTEDDGSDDHDTGNDGEEDVMLISRNGQDFSMSGHGSVIAMPVDQTPAESDRGSIEVVPPTPTSSKQVSN
jgi:hypothetical protein